MTAPAIGLATGPAASRSRTPVLDRVTGPDALRGLAQEELAALAAEIREELVTGVGRAGGHLGPNLGVVELTIALHRVFTSPRDVLVWDTGHQSYVHKMLTGRVAGFSRLRQFGGLSGYPSRAESEHDVVENSHASTALSYADGIAKAWEITGQDDRRVVAVVGDGAMTGGMTWEALNNLAAAPHRPVVVVLNDNGRSYEPTVGALGRHLAELRSGTGHGNLFEDLGLAYLGPVDGHDLVAVERVLRTAAVLRHPVLVHCVTRKGAGHAAAESDEADRQHTVPPVPAAPPVAEGPSWTSVFADELLAVGRQRPDVVAVTAAMRRPTGLFPFACHFPGRVFDVGIAEQHAVTSAAGLAMQGLHPVVAIYATFVNRAFDQVLMDVALHRLPVTFVLDRAGITGPDGASHHGMWDVGLFGLVPGVRVCAPRDATQLRALLRECVADATGPTMLRFPRGHGSRELPARAAWGSADLVAEPPPAGGGRGTPAADDVLVVAVGPLCVAATEAASRLRRLGLRVAVADPRWVSPVDPELTRRAAGYRHVVTVEDNAVDGGFGEALAGDLRRLGASSRLLTLGLPRAFLPAGEREELLAVHGLDAAGLTRSVAAFLGR
jgi:1-deoxy-D-xylulose-5-phosphate synthase